MRHTRISPARAISAAICSLRTPELPPRPLALDVDVDLHLGEFDRGRAARAGTHPACLQFAQGDAHFVAAFRAGEVDFGHFTSLSAISARRRPCEMHSARSSSLIGWSSAMPAKWLAP